MAAGAYAAAVSLIHVLIRIMHPACPASFDKSQIQCLYDKVSWLVDFIEAYSQTITKDFQTKVTVFSFKAEDVIESYIVSQIRTGSPGHGDVGYATLRQDLEKAICEMDLIIQESMEFKEKNHENHQLPVSSVHFAGTSVLPGETVKTASFNQALNLLLVQLMNLRELGRKVIPITGMGGIGKTTLARNVHCHQRIKHHFDVIAWVTISQVYTIGTILRALLRDIGVEEVDHIGNQRLGEELHKFLYSRRYIFVLDDIWDAEAWDGIMRFLPDNNNGSRVLLTTRNAALGVGSCDSYEMELLDSDKSWDLLVAKVFGQDVCPPKLEECGKGIARSCKGLPLVIVLISGLLKTVGKKLEQWEDVAKNISSIRQHSDHCLEILSLSYHRLPVHLKPCFLYMASFPEDHIIDVPLVIKLWVADGIIKPNSDRTLEDVALGYLNDLANRNLIMAKMRSCIGEMRSFVIHDLVRDLCIREARKEGFLCVNGASFGCPGIEGTRRLINTKTPNDISREVRERVFTRSFVCWGGNQCISGFNLLRVYYVARLLDVVGDIMRQVNLRLLRLSLEDWSLGSLFSLLPSLWNLETFIGDVSRTRGRHCLPSEFWELHNIRHFVTTDNTGTHLAIYFQRKARVILPDPPSTHADFVLENLQTLETVGVSSDKVINNIPNIRKLGIRYMPNEDMKLSPCFANLAQCHKLETLNFSTDTLYNHTAIKFPDHLRELSLRGTKIPWDCITTIGSLPNLEVLRLRRNAFCGKEWETAEGEFQCLKSLSMGRCYLKTWRVEDCSHYPSLEDLNLERMSYLMEIPVEFADSMTLKSIKVDCCPNSVVISTEKILEEQEAMENYDLIVEVVHPYLGSSWKGGRI